MNHRGWIVLDSIASDDGSLCADLFEDPGGGFGFEQLRADPEDVGRWTAIGGFASARYESPRASADAAGATITWLRDQPGAARSWDAARTRFDE